MDHLPVFLNLRKQRAIVAGDGDALVQRTRTLLDAGAQVEIWSSLAQPEGIEGLFVNTAPFTEHDLGGAHIIMLCFDDVQQNERIAELADAHGLPVNVRNNPQLSNFIMPAIIDRSPVLAAVSTGGASPALARIIRARLELLIPQSYGRLAKLAGSMSEQVRTRLPSATARRRFWEQIFDGQVAEHMHSGHEMQAEQAMRSLLSSYNDVEASQHAQQGEVALVGAGPGDPDLLTFRALRLVQRADVLVHDRLISKQVLALARRDAQLIYAGKARDRHSMQQENINALLVRLAKKGKRVVRLKGGDPFTFARGGEEIETLCAEGIAFQVVPGITAATGCAAYAGIPLTHRDHSQACVFVTGHLRDGSVDLNWPMLAQARQTVVIYMGLHGLPVICQQLIAHGLPAHTPAALIQQGTTRDQRVFTGTLQTLVENVAQAGGAKAPTLIIVGEVVSLRDKLNWFEPQEASAQLALLNHERASGD